MMSGILGFLTKLPQTVKIGLVVGALFVGFEIKHRIDTTKLNNQIVSLSSALQAEQLAEIKLQVSIDHQNLAISELALKQTQITAEASNRALKIMRAEQSKSTNLKSPSSPIPSGAKGMNEWLNSELGGR